MYIYQILGRQGLMKHGLALIHIECQMVEGLCAGLVLVWWPTYKGPRLLQIDLSSAGDELEVS